VLSQAFISSRRHLAGALLGASLLVPAFHRDSTSPFHAPVHHSRISVLRQEDGTLRLGQRNEVQSDNWSGYVLSNYVTGQTYASAKVSWTVPKVTYQAPPETCHMSHNRSSSGASQVCFAQNVEAEYSSTWVGIGGNCENANCTRTDSTLIQLGTEQDAAADGSTQYYAWYELLPADSITIATAPTTTAGTGRGCRKGTCTTAGTPYPVQPGDAMTASLVCQSNCTAGQSQTWLLTMADTTQKWTFSTTLTYKSTLASVEWIQEAPASNAGVLPLADFGTETLDPTDDGGANPNIPNAANGTVGPDAITMVNSYGETSQPSPVASLDAFSVCWGNNPNNIASCPAP
jgi:hypothetical protein